MRPTAPDRERLASGIELAQHLAEAVKEAQQQVLDRHLGTVKQQERKFFADMQSQKKYEQVCAFHTIHTIVGAEAGVIRGEIRSLQRSCALIMRGIAQGKLQWWKRCQLAWWRHSTCLAAHTPWAREPRASACVGGWAQGQQERQVVFQRV